VNNTAAGTLHSLQSICTDVFYICSWYPDTLTQCNISIKLNTPPINGTRDTVYRELFNFIPEEMINDHLLVTVDLSCPCNSNGTMTQCIA